MYFFDDYTKFESRSLAVCEDGTNLCYRDLTAFSKQIGVHVPKRSLLFSFCSNTAGSLLGYLAFLNNRIVPVMVDSGIDAALVAQLIDTYQPQYLYLPQNMAAQYPYAAPVFTAYGYTLLKTNFDTVYPLYDELALLITTSGSTGSPKLVRQSYQNLQANATSIVEYLEIDETERPISTLPMNYVYGISIINSHVQMGATLLFTTKSIMQKEFWTFFKEQNATSFGGVPYTYEMLKRLRFFNMDLPSLRYMTQAGGKLVPALHKEFAEYAQAQGKRFYIMYGAAEATSRMGYLPWQKSLEKYGSMGYVIPGGCFTLIDADDKPITTPDTVGELVYSGKNVTLGYALCGADLAKGDERGGILQTGDMAKFDADGFYYIVGRKARFIKIYGNRVSLDECERMIKAKYEQADCACVGVDDKMTIYLTDETLLPAVVHYVADTTHLNRNAFCAKFIETIPKNESGKTMYAKLDT
ncbi:MAG: AMP-binding protein [Oscillospiraceae bacterium]|nr:AMP-binding protein [Oscillospiraceae bacterium]